ncbi:FMN-binding negative transcriptional regulator [Puniceibacterium sp. IMCC21224]|uniref:FMN-binding negative transcriptional regulator n=1 Tax=Puniceibacterium sp. IMCC21224 TaxID=1618204 RepID=UPI00064DBE12|nr:FMN-binding negative transcriptional regulator [Puniceibacterium sp. IMCC21224]KMK68510.1 negative transcriptional regulator, PaiB family [Puniceibacterium sp. IMCC21224]
MHPNPVFHSADHAKDIAVARQRGFGMLALSAQGAPLLSHIPFLLSEDGREADLHLVRSNPIARLKGPQPARLAVTGPDSYISPDWYGLDDQVPTWNYVAIQLTGTLEPLPDTAMRDMLDRQSAAYEARLAPKPAWTTSKMTPEALSRLMRMILPFRLHVADISATWKLGQNKPDAARHSAADGAQNAGLGNDTPTLAALMREPPKL